MKRSGLWSRWQSWVVGDHDDPTDLRLETLRTVAFATLALVALGVPTLIQYAVLGLWRLVAAVLVAVVLGVVNLLVLRSGQRTRVAAHSSALLLFALLLVSNLNSGGFYDPNFGWFYAMPLVGAVVLGLRAAWGWTVVMVGVTLAFYAAPSVGLEIADRVPPHLHGAQSLFNRLSALLGIAVLASAFVATQRRTQRGLRRALERIRGLAYEDSLTGLANRKAFTNQLRRSVEESRRLNRQFGLLFVDLDAFKRINDSLGHAAGDALLKEVARRFENTLRGGDVVGVGPGVSRLGGDEFTVLVNNLDTPHSAVCVAERLLRALGEPVQLMGREVFARASIGIAVYPEDGLDSTDLLRHADAAMYESKRLRRGWSRYAPKDTEEATDRLRLESALRRALPAGEVVAFYQPLFAASGELAGFEALARWTSPELGRVPPDVFIPVAEEIGLVYDIGQVMLTNACDLLTHLPEGLRVAVNLSARELQRPGLLERVSEVIASAGAPPDGLEVEVTERALIEDDAVVARSLRALAALGVSVALDDFGTGFSSLNHLRSFPIDRVKIDRSFVADLETDPDAAALTRAVVALARQLEIAVVAEGVETEEQRRFLVDLGCEELQGYLLGRPVPRGEALRLAQAQGSVASSSSASSASRKRSATSV